MQSTRSSRPVLPAALALALSLAGCAGGGGGGPIAIPVPRATSAAPASGVTAASFTIQWPARAVGSAVARRPQYLSPSIASLSIAIDAAGSPTIVNAPVATGSPQSTTVVIPVSPGSHAVTVAEYDAAGATGNLLGRVMQTNTIVAGQLNTIAYTLNGNLAKIVLQAASSPFVEGSIAAGVTLVGCAPQTFMAVPQDADGNTIVAPGLVPAVTVATAAAIVATPLAATNAFTLEAPAPVAATAVTAKGANLDGTAVTATLNVAALAAFYVADFTVQKIDAFDENGTPLALPATAFANITNPMGLAATPCTATAPGDIYLTQTSNYAVPYVQEFDSNGVAQTLPATAFPFAAGDYVETQPLFLTYDADTAQLVVPNTYSSTVSIFDPAGNAVPTASGSFSKLLQPVSVAYDPHDRRFYVTSDGASSLSSYTNGGTLGTVVTTNSHPMGVVFDPNNDSLYVASGGTAGSALDQVAPAPANVAEYSEVPAAVTTTGGFLATSTTAFYTGIAYDPYSKQLYVSDAGDSKIVAYTEAGAAVTLATGAFSTINATTSPKADPMAILFVP